MVRGDKLLITGADGRLGRDLVGVLGNSYEVVGVDLADADLGDPTQVSSLIKSIKPHTVLHAAAYTDVDGCESDETLAWAVNADGTRNVAEACRDGNIRMLYYSTDYVFDGQKDTPYVEEDRPNPTTVYGQSKLAGEKAVAELLDDYGIFRIAWLYGRYGQSFVATMIRLGTEQLQVAKTGESTTPLRVVDDQLGNPTWTEDVARQTELWLLSDARGLFHATAQGEASWYRFACDVFELASMDVHLERCQSAEFPRPAQRPARSSLENGRLKAANLDIMPEYRASLEEFMRHHFEEISHEM